MGRLRLQFFGPAYLELWSGDRLDGVGWRQEHLGHGLLVWATEDPWEYDTKAGVTDYAWKRTFYERARRRHVLAPGHEHRSPRRAGAYPRPAHRGGQMSYDIDLVFVAPGQSTAEAVDAAFEGEELDATPIDLRSVGERLVGVLPRDAEVSISRGAVSGHVPSLRLTFDLDHRAGGQINLPLSPTTEVWTAVLDMIRVVTEGSPFVAWDPQRVWPWRPGGELMRAALGIWT
jgi:hypothetical protein